MVGGGGIRCKGWHLLSYLTSAGPCSWVGGCDACVVRDCGCRETSCLVGLVTPTPLVQ